MDELYLEAEKIGIARDNVRQILFRIRNFVKGNNGLRDTMSFITFDPKRVEIVDLFLNCEEYLKVSLLLEPENSDYKNLLGLNYIKLKKFNDAIKLFNLVLENQFDN